MIKNNKFKRKTLGYKANLHTVKMPRTCVAMPTTDIVQLIANQRRKREIAPRLMFVCTGH